MQTISMRLITIVAEPVLADRLTHDVQRLGATGWTLTEGRGSGSRGTHAEEVPGSAVRLECVATAEACARILCELAEAYFPHYGVVAWVMPVDVVRGDKFA